MITLSICPTVLLNDDCYVLYAVEALTKFEHNHCYVLCALEASRYYICQPHAYVCCVYVYCGMCCLLLSCSLSREAVQLILLGCCDILINVNFIT